MKRFLSLLLAAALTAALLVSPAFAAAPPWVQVDGQGTASQTITLRGLSGTFDSAQITLTLDRAPTGFQFAQALSDVDAHTALTVSGNSITLYVTSQNQINQGDALLLGVLSAGSAFKVLSASGVKLLDLEAGSTRELSYATVSVGAAATALPAHVKNGYVERRALVPAVCAGLVCSALAAWAATAMDVEVLRKCFGGFLLVIGLRELFREEKS